MRIQAANEDNSQITPEAWRVVHLGDTAIANVRSGGTPSRGEKYFFGGPIPWVKSGELEDNVITHTEETLTELGLAHSSANMLPKGTLLLAMYGATAGKTAILGIDATTNQAICSIIPVGDWFTPRFLQYYLIHIRPQLLNARYGGAQPNISQTIVKSLRIPLPPLSEQKKIAAILSKIQQAIEVQEKIVERTKELKKALTAKIFTEGLLGEEKKESEIGIIPKSWEVVQIEELVRDGVLEKPLDGNHGNIHPKASDYVEIGVPFIMASDLVDGTVNFKTCKFITKAQADSLQKGFSYTGDVLITHKATIGVTAIVPSIDGYIMLTPQVTYYRVLNPSVLDPRFLKCFFDSDAFQKRFVAVASDGSTRPYIGITKQRSLSLACPRIEEQREIASVFKSLDDKSSIAMKRRDSHRSLFKSMLHQLMTGRIRVNNIEVPFDD